VWVRRASLLVATAAMALAPGCGSSSTSAPSTSDLIAKGDTICNQAQAEFDQAVRSQQVGNPAQAEKLTSTLLQISESELAKLRALTPPDDLKAAFDSYLASREKGVEMIKQANQAAADNNPQGYFAAISRLHQTQKQRSGLADKVGFTHCSQELVPGSPSAG
jgi:hypothetical protein